MRLWIFLGIAAVAVIGGLVWANGGQECASCGTEEELTYAQVQASLADGGSLYDVRTAEEFSEGHIAEATLFPLADLQAGVLPEDEADAEIYVYCRSGNRSAQATALLEEAGYTNVTDLGGISEVVAIGGEITQ